MSKYLILIRHAKSDWSQRVRDYKRPLKKKGRRDSQRIAVWLAQQKLIPERIIASSADRCKSTALKLLQTMELNSELLKSSKNLYLSSKSDYIKKIKQVPENINNLIVIGHNPVIESLFCSLVKSSNAINSEKCKKKDKVFPTAAVAVMEMRGKWSKLSYNSLSLNSFIKPKQLPRTFPYPDINGKEQRERPAYYYKQSGVIPYRLEKGNLQILLISSSTGSHYILPKGIKEQGLNLRESAKKEALEEAGIDGIVDKKPIGDYQFEKWGANCQVTMYTMLVTSMLGKYKWKETYRERHWVSPKKAKKMLKKEYFVKLIDKLTLQIKIKS